MVVDLLWLNRFKESIEYKFYELKTEMKKQNEFLEKILKELKRQSRNR